MSTLKVTNIQATGETASRAVSGVAAAWVNFNGTGTVAVRDSQGVSGLVDNGSGDYTVNFTSNMANANYASPAQVGNSTLGRYGGLNDSDGKLVGSAIFYGFQTSTGTALDPAEYSISIHGDLA